MPFPCEENKHMGKNSNQYFNGWYILHKASIV